MPTQNLMGAVAPVGNGPFAGVVTGLNHGKSVSLTRPHQHPHPSKGAAT